MAGHGLPAVVQRRKPDAMPPSLRICPHESCGLSRMQQLRQALIVVRSCSVPELDAANT